MRYTHGCKPRNPYNMIIQENHVTDRANLIISRLTFSLEKKRPRKETSPKIEMKMNSISIFIYI